GKVAGKRRSRKDLAHLGQPAAPLAGHRPATELSFCWVVLSMDGGPPGGGCHMNEDVIIPGLLQRSTIWTALLGGLAPAMVASFKRRSMMPWYLYGFACTLVALPLITLPTIHAFLLRPRTLSPEARRKKRRADALAPPAESQLRCCPTRTSRLKLTQTVGISA